MFKLDSISHPYMPCQTYILNEQKQNYLNKMRFVLDVEELKLLEAKLTTTPNSDVQVFLKQIDENVIGADTVMRLQFASLCEPNEEKRKAAFAEWFHYTRNCKVAEFQTKSAEITKKYVEQQGPHNLDFEKRRARLIGKLAKKKLDEAIDSPYSFIGQLIGSNGYRKTAEKILKESTGLTKNSNAQQNRKKKRKNKKSNKAAFKQPVIQKNSKKNQRQVCHQKAEATNKIETHSRTDIRKIFYSNLQHRTNRLKLHNRVTRWIDADETEIRSFNESYAILSSKQIMKEKDKHSLVMVERLLEKPYRDIYSFSTDRGAGMVALLERNGKTTQGIIYFGINRENRIYHKYFEKTAFQNFDENIFSKTVEDEIDESNEADEKTPSQAVEIYEANGEVTFCYSSNYKVKILPLRRDLLTREIAIEPSKVKVT